MGGRTKLAESFTDDQVRLLMQVASSARRVEREECAKLCELRAAAQPIELHDLCLELAGLMRMRKNGD